MRRGEEARGGEEEEKRGNETRGDEERDKCIFYINRKHSQANTAICQILLVSMNE